MDTVIYIIWASIPTFFFLMALWLKLESISGKKKHNDEVIDFLRQGGFVLVCVAVSFLLYEFLCIRYLNPMLDGIVPAPLIKLFVLPVVLYIAALIFGPTKDIKITKAPHPSANRRRR